MKIVSILKDVQYNPDRPAISVLMESDFTKEIRIVFKHGQHMKEHKAPYPITVEVVEGTIDFGVYGNSNKLNRGDLISLSGNVAHDLTAKADSIVRLTLSKNDSISRVENVV